jgi:predicted RNA-binding protein with PUA-like domain
MLAGLGTINNRRWYNYAMNYFLAKTDPKTYSIDDFAKEGETTWDGVHNNAALLVIQKMRPGDQVFIYHSQSDKSILGLAEVITLPRENEIDPRRSWVVDMKFIKRFPHPLTLVAIKSDPANDSFDLVRQSRLSTMTVEAKTATRLLEQLEGK